MKNPICLIKMIAFALLAASLGMTAQASSLKCGHQAERTVRAILTIQEAQPVTVRVQNASSVSDDLGTVETFDIQGYVKIASGPLAKVRVPSRIRLVPEATTCAVLDYALPEAN